MRAPAAQTHAQTRQHTQAAWGDDRARVGVRHVLVGELLCRAVDVHAGERVLDVAAGSGNAALAAARRGARVIASDIARVALESARQRADAEGLALHTELADAQALPFDDAAFDVVLSTFGAMFAPDLASDLATDLERFNRARDGTFAAAAEYLQATAVRAIAARKRSATERPNPRRSTLDSQGHSHR